MHGGQSKTKHTVPADNITLSEFFRGKQVKSGFQEGHVK